MRMLDLFFSLAPCSGNFSVANGDYRASYLARGDSVMFSVSARTSGWVAIGISNDESMVSITLGKVMRSVNAVSS